MKIFISSDMEGTAGITAWPETEKDKAEYTQWSAHMTKEAAAACFGAAEGGADSILLKDAHDFARNIDPEALPECARIFRGWGRTPLSMMAGLDESFGGVLFTGYHSGAGMPTNPLSHTMNTQNLTVKCNGLLMPEAAINAMTASMLGVPVLMVTGDKGICDFMKGFVPGMETVAVSEGMGAGSISLQPEAARKLIREAAARAVKKAGTIPCYPLPPHFEIEITFKEHAKAREVSWYPGMRQTGPFTVCYSSDKYMDVLTMFHFCL